MSRKKKTQIDEHFLNELKENVPYPELIDLQLYENEKFVGVTFLAEKYSAKEQRFLQDFFLNKGVFMNVIIKPHNEKYLKIKMFKPRKS